jgi:hypothetical protein
LTGSALLLSSDGTAAGVPSTVKQLAADAVVATETATAVRADRPQRSPGTPFGQNMPYIDPKFPGNSYLLYKLILGMQPPSTSSNFSADYYDCASLAEAGVLTIDGGTCDDSDGGLGTTPTKAVSSGDATPAPVEPWIPDGAWQKPVDGELDRLKARIGGAAMPYPTGGEPRASVLTLGAWIEQGARSDGCPP